MSTAIAKNDVGFSSDQAAIVKEVLCPGISDSQLAMFAQVCKRTGLDPFARQIYATLRNANEGTRENPRWVKKLTIQTGIDGFRLIAERTQKYAGQGAFEWCGKDGVWRDIWLEREPPAAARATVYRTDWQQPIVRIARWSAYNQDNSMWKKMDAEQLAKCAEALCLRAAFPQDMSGLYTDDEMHQADNDPSRPAEVRATVVERAPAQLPPPAAERNQPLPTKTAKNYPEKQYAEVPFSSLPSSALASYLNYYTERLPTLQQANHRKAVEATILAAQAEAQRRLDAEAAGADPETGEVLSDEELDDRNPFPVEGQAS